MENRLIFDAAATAVFAGMGANPAAAEEQGVAFANGMNRAFVIAFPNLGNIQRDIDLGRTNLSAGRQAVVLPCLN